MTLEPFDPALAATASTWAATDLEARTWCARPEDRLGDGYRTHRVTGEDGTGHVASKEADAVTVPRQEDGPAPPDGGG